MSNVNLIIGGRPFAVACAKGEEKHLAALGQMIDAKLASMESVSGQNEARMLLFAALLLADEVHEARSSSTVAKTPTLPDGANLPEGPNLPEGFAEKLGAIAEQMENIALRLETDVSNA